MSDTHHIQAELTRDQYKALHSLKTDLNMTWSQLVIYALESLLERFSPATTESQ